MTIKLNFDWICFDTKYEFDQIKIYFEVINNQLNELKRNNLESIKASIENSEEVDEDEYNILLQEHYHQYEGNLPRCLSYSFVTMIYTTLETRLNRLCNNLTKKQNIELTIKDLNGSLAERVSLFFKAFNLEGIEKQDIDKITEFSRVRNLIVHENGQMHNATNKIKNYIRNNKGVSVENNQIIVEKDYCLEHLESFKIFFVNIFNKNGYKQDYTVSQSNK